MAALYLTSEQAVATYAATFQPGAHLADLTGGNRDLRIDIDLYAHIWEQRRKELRQTTMSHDAEVALQAAWQAAREDLIAAICFELDQLPLDLGVREAA